MASKRHKPEEIVSKLRQVDVLRGQGLTIADAIRLRRHYPNHIWAVDFVHDRLSNGRPYKMLTAFDEYTREALTVKVAIKMGSAEVLETLYPILLERGRPT